VAEPTGRKCPVNSSNIDAALAADEKTLERAIAAYNAVWQSWKGIDASTADSCRRTAMAAALGAIGVYGKHQ
jgi:hypothetical protein